MSDLLQEFESFGSHGGSGVSTQRGSVPSVTRVSNNPFEEIELPSTSGRSQHQRPVERKNQEFPILRRQDTSKLRVPSHITHIAVSNSFLTVAVLGNSIFRFDLKSPGANEISEIKRDDDIRIHKIFQDPKAQHLVICMESKESYYLTRGGAKRPQPRLLPKLRGHLIESIAWNKTEQTEQSTGAILIGTNAGYICETVIDAQEGLIKKKLYCIEVYQLMYDMTGSPEPVTGLHMELFPHRSGGNEGKWFVLATTPCRIYQFIGHVTRGDVQFQDMFFVFNDSVKIQFQEIPGTLKDSKLCVWPTNTPDPPTAFAWLTGAGVYYSTLVFGDQEPGESLFVEKNLIPYSVVSETGEDKDVKVEWNQKDTVLPIGLSLTKFHCVLLFRDKIVAICHLNNKKVFEEPFNVRRNGPLYAMTTDPISGCIWTHGKLYLQSYIPFRESRNVWRIYLDQDRFEQAQRYAEGNQNNLDIISVRQAEHYFKKGKYEDAAVVFSKSQLSFEEVALKFIQVNKKEALKTFLHLKLDLLSQKDSTQQTMLTTWLIEMYLNELGCYKDSVQMDNYLKLQKEFHEFLCKTSLKECLENNSHTIYDIMLSHGATDDVIFFAKLMKDYERVIVYHVQQYQYDEALELLSSHAYQALQSSDRSERRAKFQKFAELYYKFSPMFVKHIPGKTVDAWKAAEKHLNPKKLIPALIQCNQPGDKNQATPEEQNAAAIKYLEFCVNKLKSNETSVHNFLVSAYANSSDTNDHKKLKDYLRLQAQDGLTPSYDVQYALRLCLERGLDEACVFIYMAMGLHEESVSLALKCNDVDLARRMIGVNPLVRKDSQLQKKLWLRIAEHVIKKEKDIKRAMQFLKDCYVLKIEDILPFFSDVVTIDQFKDAICDSLQSYNTHIDHLKKEMNTATQSAKNIRSDIQQIRNKCVCIRSTEKCNVCEGRLLSQPFYMFPCHHAFHRDCLVGEVSVMLPPTERSRIKTIIQAIDTPQQTVKPTGTTEKEDLKHQLDDLIASDCPFCGLIMIRSIAIPLLPMDTLDKNLASWQ